MHSFPLLFLEESTEYLSDAAAAFIPYLFQKYSCWQG